jgi:diacylglycerol kinase (ATP)
MNSDIPSPSTARFSLRLRLKSFTYALAGLAFMLRSQHNAWIHLAITIAVIVMGLAFEVSVSDWRWLIVAIVMVWIAETTNTAFEHLCDLVSPEFHPSVKMAKDIAAGAVLIASIGAALIGLSVFGGKVLAVFA